MTYHILFLRRSELLTSCKLRAKLRAVFKNKKSANPYEFALLGTSVARCKDQSKRKYRIFQVTNSIFMKLLRQYYVKDSAYCERNVND